MTCVISKLSCVTGRELYLHTGFIFIAWQQSSSLVSLLFALIHWHEALQPCIMSDNNNSKSVLKFDMHRGCHRHPSMVASWVQGTDDRQNHVKAYRRTCAHIGGTASSNKAIMINLLTDPHGVSELLCVQAQPSITCMSLQCCITWSGSGSWV